MYLAAIMDQEEGEKSGKVEKGKQYTNRTVSRKQIRCTYSDYCDRNHNTS